MREICPYCKTITDFIVREVTIIKYKGMDINCKEIIYTCLRCQNDVYIPEVELDNVMRFRECVKEARSNQFKKLSSQREVKSE